MKITKRRPDPFFYEGKKEVGILLIHGFTGSPAELSLLGKFLHQTGYTVYAPLLAGHGKTPEEMKKTNKDDWWNSVLEAYEHLKQKGYDRIIAIGLSMGGILALKLAMEKPLLAVIPMAAPIFVHDRRVALTRWLKYFITYSVKEKKEEHIESQLASYDRVPVICVESLHKLIKEVKVSLNKVGIPTLVIQGMNDETVVPESANYIFNNINSTLKEIKWYHQSTHIITLDNEREKLFEDIRLFLERVSK
ncbi:hypothetical protein BHF71_07695 [Vulcanibacillus modesticaldus]|uniref:Serine aminopeptidase S33 domain-containing protein n=1 Tax=Vulcanibacillus modesticaldus TaxID=337097 RepID=A0A1D2YVM2_9BACI|nr:alpha/beta fold hydrolase [Vulcanibacillus modesticaldus]OEF99703.1 hypothetical protein BHF71_07695 [Vulcanibacillus modesticaldus]